MPLDLLALKASLGRWQAGLAATGWNSLYWNNHDQPRIVSRWGDDGEHRVRSATMLATVLHLHRGTPYVYQGEELGMTNVAFASIEEFRDIEALNHFHAAVARGEDPAAVLAGMGHHRDNARTPMQWDDSPHAGFTTGTPWIAVNPNHTTINAAAARADDRSVFHHYRRLIELRHTVRGRRRRRLHDAPPRPPARLRVHPVARRRGAARRRQLLRRRTSRWTGSRMPTTGAERRARASATSTTPAPIDGRAAPVGSRRVAPGGMIR